MISSAIFRAVFSKTDAAISNNHELQWVGVGIILLSLTSCGSQVTHKLPPKKPCINVAGKVLVDGAPAEGVEIILHPTDEGHGLYQFPNGMTNTEGEFKLKTYASNDGAPKGNYVAVFVWPIPVNEQVDDDDRLKRLYRDPFKSKFKVTIDDTNSKLEPFDLKLKGLKGIPLSKSDLQEIKHRQNQKLIGSK